MNYTLKLDGIFVNFLSIFYHIRSKMRIKEIIPLFVLRESFILFHLQSLAVLFNSAKRVCIETFLLNSSQKTSWKRRNTWNKIFARQIGFDISSTKKRMKHTSVTHSFQIVDFLKNEGNTWQISISRWMYWHFSDMQWFKKWVLYAQSDTYSKVMASMTSRKNLPCSIETLENFLLKISSLPMSLSTVNHIFCIRYCFKILYTKKLNFMSSVTNSNRYV